MPQQVAQNEDATDARDPLPEFDEMAEVVLDAFCSEDSFPWTPWRKPSKAIGLKATPRKGNRSLTYGERVTQQLRDIIH